MKLDELKAFAGAEGFRPFVIKTKGGLTVEVPHPEFVTIPPDEEASFIRGAFQKEHTATGIRS
jgi:hypothetical protein